MSKRQKRTVIYEHGKAVECCWDAEAGVWYVSGGDVHGLNAEGATLVELRAQVRVMIPELLEAA